MSDQATSSALTKEQEAMGTAPAQSYTVAPGSFPGPPGYTATPLPEGAMQMAYVPGSGQPVAYMPGSAQPITLVPQQMRIVEPKEFITDYYKLALVTAVIFAILTGPITLITGIPAVYTAHKSRKMIKEGNLDRAKTLSVTSAYLTVATLVIGLLAIMAIVLIPYGLRFQIGRFLGTDFLLP